MIFCLPKRAMFLEKVILIDAKKDLIFKEELHNRFNLISEERVKMFKHNSENLMKIG